MLEIEIEPVGNKCQKGLTSLIQNQTCPYNVLDMIDYGSFGDIYKVKNETDNKTYAMKQVKFRNNFHDDPYIMSEIYCLTNLKHKNIIQLHEIVVDINELHFIMEYAVNENLERYLSDHPDMDFHQRYKIYSQVLQGLQYCHSMDVAHRDLTPANILLTEDMVVKLADFGLSVKCFTGKLNNVQMLTKHLQKCYCHLVNYIFVHS